jgi:hypothetical protein
MDTMEYGPGTPHRAACVPRLPRRGIGRTTRTGGRRLVPATLLRKPKDLLLVVLLLRRLGALDASPEPR